MKVKELIRILQKYESDTEVVLAEELGIGNINSVSLEELWLCDFGRYSAWSLPVEYPRTILKKEHKVVIF